MAMMIADFATSVPRRNSYFGTVSGKIYTIIIIYIYTGSFVNGYSEDGISAISSLR